MINLKNKTYRNLEEQVLDNQNQIEALKAINLKGFINIVGNVNNIENLPDPYTGNVGDFYLVKNTSPTPDDLYMYGTTGPNNLGWIYISTFPFTGPRGIQGPKGNPGNNGINAKWYCSSRFPNSPNEGDMFLNTTNYQVYRYENGGWISQCNIKGLPGESGTNGNSIVSIAHYHSNANHNTIVTITTSQGGVTQFSIPDGEAGHGFHVQYVYPSEPPYPETLPVDIIDTLEQLYPAANQDPSAAVLVRTQSGSYLYVIVSDGFNSVWDEAGEIESVKGDTGDTGPQGVSVTNVQVNASNHLIVTLSNTDTIDAGEITVDSGTEVYQVNYGVTTFAEIQTAITAGKEIACVYSNREYRLVYNDTTTTIYLACCYDKTLFTIEITSSNTYSSSSATVMENVLTSMGDMIYAGPDGVTPNALSIGTRGQVMTVNNSATGPQWSSLMTVKQITGSGLDVEQLKTLILNIIKSSWNTLGPQKILNICLDPSSNISIANYSRKVTIPASGTLTVPSGSAGTSQFSMNVLRAGYWNMFTVLINNIQTGSGVTPTSFTLVGNSVPSNYILQTYIELGTSYSFRANLIQPPQLTSSSASGTLTVESGVMTYTSSQVSTCPTFDYKITYIDDGSTFTIPT